MTQSWFGFIKVQLLFAWSNITTFASHMCFDNFRKNLGRSFIQFSKKISNLKKEPTFFSAWRFQMSFSFKRQHFTKDEDYWCAMTQCDDNGRKVKVFFCVFKMKKKRQWAEIIFRTGKPTVHNHHHHLWDAHTYPPLPIMQRAAACAPYSWPFNTTHQQGRSPHCISNKKLTSVWLKIYFPSNYYP